jgi:superfamily II DNA or RNA helicase
MALPVERIPVSLIKQACTAKYLLMGAEEPTELPCYREDAEYLHVPRQYGIRVCKQYGIAYDDATSTGYEAVFPRIPEPRDYQIDPLLDLQQCTESYYDFLFRARTGWGKTIGSLILAARLGVSTIILVDQENLKEQWIKTLIDPKLFGFALEDIGIVQGKVCKYEGCAVTIAMVQTLSQRSYPHEFYAYFGLLIVDEVHIIAAPTFSQPLLDFPAMYRIGVSATPKRKDGLQRVLDYNLGKVRVYVADEHEVNSVYVAEHPTVYSWYANISPKVGRFITEVSEDGSRNLLVAESATFLYDTGRDVLVLSDRIEHLKHLMTLCEYLGVPAEDMGLYAGYNPSYGYAKNPTPMRRPEGLTRNDDTGEFEYTPISLQLIAKRIKKTVLKGILEGARMIFATYGMFQKGVDVPRLTGGVDATPRSSSEQVHGRILRQQDGALRSIWITIADINSYRSLHGVSERITDYMRNNAEVFQWTLEEGEQPCNGKALKAAYRDESKRLKSLRIETNSAGLNTLLSPSARIESAKTTVNAIRERTRDQPRPSRTGSTPLARSARLPARGSSTPSPARPSPYLKRRRR